jgi:hypothetical protein
VLRAEAEGELPEAIWSEDLSGLPSVFLKAARAGLRPGELDLTPPPRAALIRAS